MWAQCRTGMEWDMVNSWAVNATLSTGRGAGLLSPLWLQEAASPNTLISWVTCPWELAFCILHPHPSWSHQPRGRLASMAKKAIKAHPVQLCFSWQGEGGGRGRLAHFATWMPCPNHRPFISKSSEKSYTHTPNSRPYTSRPMKPSWPKTFVSFPSFCDLTSDFTEHQTRKSVSQFGATPCLRLKKKKKSATITYSVCSLPGHTAWH
jgi:hypothetical protein